MRSIVSNHQVIRQRFLLASAVIVMAAGIFFLFHRKSSQHQTSGFSLTNQFQETAKRTLEFNFAKSVAPPHPVKVDTAKFNLLEDTDQQELSTFASDECTQGLKTILMHSTVLFKRLIQTKIHFQNQ